MRNISVATEIVLNEKQVEKICRAVGGDAPASAKVSEVATTLTRDFVDGGVMLPTAVVDRIEAAISSVDPERIAEGVEASVNRKGPHIVLNLTIDPGWYPALKEASESQGRPIEDLMQECMAHAFAQGWLYALPAEPPPLLITRDDQEFLKKTLGVKTLFGSDVVNWIRELAGVEREAVEAGR